MRRWVSILAGVMLLLGGTSCQALRGATGGVTEAAADALLPPAEEQRLGDELAREVERELPVHQDPQVQAYLRNLGASVLRSADRRGHVHEDIQFNFTVIDDDEQVNAFALPGGGIYVFSGLLLAADSTAEIAGVLAHEVAHVTRRHIAQRLTAQYGLSALLGLALGDNPGLAKQVVAQIVGTGALLSFSREQERDADQFAIPYVADAGYSPTGLVRFFERMATLQGEVPGALQFLQTHPAPEERVRLAQEQIAQMDDAPTRTGHEEHTTFKEQVL